MVNKLEWLFNIINIPLSYILNFFSDLMGNSFAAAVFVFTVFINAAMIPLSIKSQKASVGQMRIKPKLDMLKKKYGDDKQRYSQEMQKLYQEENISMSGGCLPLLIRMPIMFSIYYLITKPLTYLMHVSADTINTLAETIGITATNYSKELAIIDAVSKNNSISAEIAAKISDIDFTLWGIDLTSTPKFTINIFEGAQLNWIIPFAAFAAQMLTSFASVKMQKKVNPDAPSMTGMLLTMPLISLFIGFTVPAVVGFYWACSSLVAGGIQIAVQYFYGPQKMLATERAKEIIKVYDDEQKFISKRVAKDDE
jgi:YidC/Oxa1 family membrane protein insertase